MHKKGIANSRSSPPKYCRRLQSTRIQHSISCVALSVLRLRMEWIVCCVKKHRGIFYSRKSICRLVKFMQSITEEKDSTNNLVAATAKGISCYFLRPLHCWRCTPLNFCTTQESFYSFKRCRKGAGGEGEYSIAAPSTSRYIHPPEHLFRKSCNSGNNISSPFVVWKIEWEIEYT